MGTRLILVLLLLYSHLSRIESATCEPSPLPAKNAYYVFTDIQQTSYDYNSTVTLKEMAGKIYFNFCSRTVFRCPWESSSSGYIYISNTDNTLCFPLTTSADANYSFINVNNASTGIVVKYQPSTNFSNYFNLSGYSIQVLVYCNTDVNTTDNGTNLNFDGLAEGKNSNLTIKVDSPNGCPYTQSEPIWNFFSKIQFISFTLLVSMGSIIAFFGGKMIKGLFIASIASAIFWPAMFLLFNFISVNDVKTYWEAIIFLVSLGSGALASFFLAKYKRIGAISLGMWTALVTAMQFYLGVIAQIADNPSTLSLVLILIISAVVGAYLGNFYHDSKILYIFCSSFLGSYLSIRGVALYLNDYPNVFEFSRKHSVENAVVGWQFYVYVVVQLIINVIGFYIQWSVLREEEQDNENFMVDDQYYKVEKTRHQIGIALPENHKNKAPPGPEFEKAKCDSDYSERLSPSSKDPSNVLNHYQSGTVKITPMLSTEKIDPELLEVVKSPI